MILRYDGTFEGFLTAVYYVYEQQMDLVDIQKETINSVPLFDALQTVVTDTTKSDRVWNGIFKIGSKRLQNYLLKVFLSELPQAERCMLHLIRKSFTSRKSMHTDYADPGILEVSKIVKQVDREKHRMEAFVRFRLLQDGTYVAQVSPDFDVLPLISRHFKNRYADQRWMIYDMNRNYGIYYDLHKVNTISIALATMGDLTKSILAKIPTEEHNFESLWKDYFRSTTIKSRKNTQLHLRHVPKRYWKYLSEKQN